MTRHTIGILGGSGFVGSHLCASLIKAGHHVRVLTRNPARHRDLNVLPELTLVAGDPRQQADLLRCLQGCDVAINLVGILNETGKPGHEFKQIHVGIPAKLAIAAKTLNIKRVLHMSALGADPENGISHYLSTKGLGEDRIHHDCPAGCYVTSFAPSVIFGPGDGFFSRFARLLALPNYFFPLPGPQTQYAPIYVGDLVTMFMQAMDERSTFGQCYQLCGPKTYTLYDLVAYTAKVINKHRIIIRLNPTLSKLQARIMEWMPGQPFTRDNYRSMQTPSICLEPMPEVFKLTLSALETIVPTYLGPNRLTTPFYDFQRKSGAHKDYD